MLFFALSTTVTAFTNVDVSSTFYSYASGFCSGGVHNADIGNGNLVNNYKGKLMLGKAHKEAYMRGAAHAKMSKDEIMAAGFRPGADTNETLSSELGGCDEQWGNTCQDSGGLYHWCNYSQYKCMSKYVQQTGAVTYSNMYKNPAAPEIYELYYDNDYDQNTSSQITKTLSSTSTQTLSVTESLTVGESIKISAGVPGIMSSEVNFSISFTLSETRTKSTTTSESFSWQGTIPEDAHSTTMVQFTVAKEKYEGDWQANINLPYYAKIWCGSRTNGHYEWFIPAPGFMGHGPPYQGKGRFTGGAGVSMHTTVRKCKLFAKTPSDCDGSELKAKVQERGRSFKELQAPLKTE